MTTKIEWAHLPGCKGETWNPIVGCRHVSKGCDNCYAEAAAAGPRLSHLPQYKGLTKDGKWSGEWRVVEKELGRPAHWRDPRSVFVCSMSDLFGAPHAEIDRVFGAMRAAPKHVFLCLTKRPAQAFAWWANRRINTLWPSNVWLGVTAETQDDADWRIPDMLFLPAPIHFVSYEPALERVDFSAYMPVVESLGESLDWIIAGGESGPGARPDSPDWYREVRDRCAAAGVPFFMKQMSKRKPIPADLMVRQFPLRG